jgi:hypothetical protein
MHVFRNNVARLCPFTVTAASKLQQFYDSKNKLPTKQEQQSLLHELNSDLECLGKSPVCINDFRRHIAR